MMPNPEPDPKDLYFESVNEHVDGLEADINGRSLETQGEVLERLSEGLYMTAVARDNDAAIACLKHSRHPTYAFWAHGLDKHANWRAGGTPFPFATFAMAAFERDCIDELGRRDLYKALPEK